jgi:integrase
MLLCPVNVARWRLITHFPPQPAEPDTREFRLKDEPARAGVAQASRFRLEEERGARIKIKMTGRCPVLNIEGASTFNSRLEYPMSSHPDQSGTILRQRMVEEMSLRNFSEKARKNHIRHVRAFAAFLGRSPDSATPDDLRRFQLHQSQSGLQPPTINSSVAALRFFFNVTADRPELTRYLSVAPRARKLPVVLSEEEVARLLDAAPGIKYKAALSVAYGAGLRVSEVGSLRVSDVDSKRMVLRVEQGKGGRTEVAAMRHAPSRTGR